MNATMGWLWRRRKAREPQWPGIAVDHVLGYAVAGENLASIAFPVGDLAILRAAAL